MMQRNPLKGMRKRNIIMPIVGFIVPIIGVIGVLIEITKEEVDLGYIKATGLASAAGFIVNALLIIR